MTSALPLAPAARRAPLLVKINLFLLGAALLALSVRLWPEWRHNPDLSHGLFMPIVFFVLLHEARSRGPARFLRPGAATRGSFIALLAGGLLALSAAGLYAAAVDWSHALVNFMLTVSLALLLGAALVAFASESVRLVPFNWSAMTAVFLWLLCAPIPPGTYTRLTLGLQLWVSEAVLRTLHVLGIPAMRHGNIIELARATVGLEEACSGVRSLISCVFAGLFFSATLVRRPWARALIIALSAPLALVMNFFRSLTLTMLANRGVDIRGTWHDVTGFAVLGITAVILGAIALLLERSPKSPAPAATAPLPPLAPAPSRTQFGLAAGLGVAATLIALFVANTRPSIHREEPVPDLFALLPANPPGWQVTTSDLYEFSGTLETDHLAQRHYVRGAANDATEVTLYVAYWRPGQAPVSLVASHTPDACWPGAGWTPMSTPAPRARLTTDGRQLADSEYRLFNSNGYPQYVWFWHLYDGRPLAYRDPYSASELLRIALRYGFRHDGAQMFVRISSNRPWSEIATEPLLADFFAHTKTLGL